MKWLSYIAALALLAGCKNDVDLTAPYKEIPSVYAVLNPQEQKQVIRVNKIFLGEGDANVMAKVADSVNYGPGEIVVSLQHFVYQSNGWTPNGSEVFFNEEMIQTSEGAFATSQRVYTSTEPLHVSGLYQLTIRNVKTGNVFIAKSEPIDRVNEGSSRPFAPPYYPYEPHTSTNEYVDYSNATTPYNVRFPPNNAKIYQLVIRVHFYDSTITGNRLDFVDYPFSTKPIESKERFANGDFIRYDFKRDDFFNAVGAALQKKNLPDNIVGRKFYMIEYIAYSSTQEYEDFLQYNSPSFGLSQQMPIYSNFIDRKAIGIFTFRTQRSVKKNPATFFVDQFSKNPNTCYYRFFSSQNLMLGCQ